MTKDEIIQWFREFLEILTVYDIVQNELPIDYLKSKDQIYGICCDDMKKIFIRSNVCNYYKRKTVVHEILHAIHHKKGDQDFYKDMSTVEAQVGQETEAILTALYGKEKQLVREKQILKIYKKQVEKEKEEEKEEDDYDVFKGV